MIEANSRVEIKMKRDEREGRKRQFFQHRFIHYNKPICSPT
jgi:hypothetical protein